MAASGRERRNRSGGREARRRTSARGRAGVERSEELQRVGGVLREAMSTDRFRRGLALGRLARSWVDVVGPRLARETAPFSLEEGGLVVSVSTGAWGAQVRFLAHEIRRRANEVLGAEEVRVVRIAVGRKEGRGRGDYGG